MASTPSWVTNPSDPNASTKMKEWLISYYLSKYGDEISDDDYALARATATAYMDAMVHAAKFMDVSETTFYDLGVEVEEKKMYHLANEEYESLYEFLGDKLFEYLKSSGNEKSGSVYETKKAIAMLTLMKKQGFHVPEVMNIRNPDSISKVKSSSRIVSRIMEEDLPKKEKEQKLREVFSDIGDKDMTVIKFKAKHGDISPVALGLQEPMTADWYMTADGSEFIVIFTNGYRGTNLIQAILEKKANIIPQVRDISHLYSFLTRDVSPKSSGMVRYRYFPDRGLEIVQHGKGMALPELPDMQRKLEALVIQHLPVLLKIESLDDDIELYLFTLLRGSSKVEDIAEAFGAPPLREGEGGLDYVLQLEEYINSTFPLNGRTNQYLWDAGYNYYLKLVKDPEHGGVNLMLRLWLRM
ncbi:MAG: hypothetical protein ACFFCT_12020 [Candidatus Odinarchaeota archaeon]